MDRDSDSEDESITDARTSSEIRECDQKLLEDEEERDQLLVESRRKKAAPISGFNKLFGKSYDGIPTAENEHKQVNSPEVPEPGTGRRQRRKARRQRKKERLKRSASEGEDGVLMYEMEEGGMKEGSATGDSSETEASFEIDRKRLRGLQEQNTRKRRGWKIWLAIHALIAVGFTVLVLFAWRLSGGLRKVVKENQKLWNNGSAVFGPTTIVISLDGFRADFLNRGLTPRLGGFIKEGVSPMYMTPSFPSVTFPNHYTLVTGLYPESHGIVGNTFWDTEMHEEFVYTDPLAMQPKWWGGEPIWVTAEKQGIRTAIHMWPGSEAHILAVEPSFVDKFNGKEGLMKKVDRILELLDKAGLEDADADVNDMRPQFIASYVPNVDSDGHRYGPNSTEILATINSVDNMLETLFEGLEDRNLTNIVNVVVVSDHGMATTDTNRLIQLEDLIDTSLIEHIDGWPLYGLRPKDPNDLHGLYDKLADEAAKNPNYDVYLRDVNMPERYHFSNNQRIAPLWVVPKTGWAIVTKDTFNVAKAKENGDLYHPMGLHGYDHEHPLMRAIFVARGPAFPHEPNSRVDNFQNIEVYNILCDSLQLNPQPNNGTLRLPLQPIGLHDPSSQIFSPPDPDADASATSEEGSGDQIISVSPIEESSAADPNVQPPHLVGVDPIEHEDEVGSIDRPVIGSDDPVVGADGKSIWEWVEAQVDRLKGAMGISTGKGGEEAVEAGKETEQRL